MISRLSGKVRSRDLKLVEWHVQCPRDMPLGKLPRRSHVEDGDQPAVGALQQLACRQRFEVVACVQVAVDQTADFGGMRFGQRAQRGNRIQCAVVGQCVEHLLAVAPWCDQAHPFELLQVLGGVCNGKPCRLSKLVDVALTLRQIVEQLQARVARQRLGDAGELSEQPLFGPLVLDMGHDPH